MNRETAISGLILAAQKDIGVEEHPRGSNRGGRVEAMLALTGLDGGYPWCAAAVCAWGLAALGKKWPLPHTADCDTLLAAGRRLGIIHASPQAGDVFLRMRTASDAVHTGIVTSAESGFWRSIEGNTNDGGSRDGYGVFARRRSGDGYLFLRFADAVDFAEPWKVVLPSGAWPPQKTRSGDDERPCVPVRAFVAALLGVSLESAPVAWDGSSATVNGKPVTTFLVDGSGWATVRDVATALGCSIAVEGRSVIVGAAKP
jgi:hypothetical protein